MDFTEQRTPGGGKPTPAGQRGGTVMPDDRTLFVSADGDGRYFGQSLPETSAPISSDSGKTRVVVVVGATASGKTALAVRLANRFDGEVISFDSMQIYRGMPIGTAQPTEEETAGIPHHLIGFLPPDVPFSCAEYVTLAKERIGEVAGRGKLPVLCGGTGLYLDSLLRGGSFFETGNDPAYREQLLSLVRERGAEYVHDLLRAVDPESADAIHPNNRKRVIRALEIYHTTGKTKTELDRASRERRSDYDATIVGIRFADRALLYRRIDERVDRMLADGLAEEARTLREAGVFRVNSTAAQAIGYKELFGYLDRTESLDDAAGTLKRATRRYAKRQLTWFGANPDIRWVDADRNGILRPFDTVVTDAERILGDCGFGVHGDKK